MSLMNSYKLLVLDVDGTILNKNGIISIEDKNTLAKVYASGIGVSLSTGRVAQACYHIIKQLALDNYHIFCDGALVGNPDRGKVIYAKPIEKTIVKEKIVFFSKCNIHKVV